MTNIDKHQPGTPTWFDLMTPDIEKARAFYKSLFGWDYDVNGPEAGNYSTAKVQGRKAAGMGSLPPGAPFPSAWTMYFSVENADAAADAIKANGGTVMMGPMDIFEEGRMTVAQDPAGAVFGTWQPKNHTGAQIRDVHGTMGWQECFTRDVPKTREFYGKTFKLEPVKLFEEGGMDYWTLNRGQETYAGIYSDPKMPNEVPAHWMIYFSVESADKTVETAKANGGKLVHGPQDTPYGRFAIINDPWNAVFAVIDPSSKKK
jgi:predicted enzyme related to lactoylglutathione lyase